MKSTHELYYNLAGEGLMKELRSISIRRTIFDAAIIYLMIFLTIFFISSCEAENFFVIILKIVFLILSSAVIHNWCNVQLHEASHYLLIKNKYLNDILCNLIYSGWLLETVSSYRKTHMKHHRYLNGAGDPDLWIYSNKNILDKQVLKYLVADLSLKTLFARIKQKKSTGNISIFVIFNFLVIQISLLTTLIYYSGIISGFIYYLAWCYGYIGVFPILIRIRTIAQHYQSPNRSKFLKFCARTTEGSILEKIIIGARMDYHHEHHIFPTIPYYNLKKLHHLLRNKISSEDLPNRYTNNYIKYYFRVLKIDG